MSSTLDRLLKIQGGTELITMRNVVANKAMLQGDNQQASYPSERETWAALYRLYAKYAPLLRAAAVLDDDNNQACSLFSEASKEIAAIDSTCGIVGERLALPVYNLLGQLYEEERDRHNEVCEAM